MAVPPSNRGRGIGSFILDSLERRAAQDSSRAIFARGKGHDPTSLEWAQRRGYRIERKRTEAILDPAEFDDTGFFGSLEDLRSIGIDIRTLMDEAAEQYYPGMYRVEIETSYDVPYRSEGSTDQSYDSWVRDYKETSAHKLFTVALDGDEVVGFTMVWMPQTEGESAAVAYTGVLKEYRRKGIARALKVASTIEAARGGAPRMRTHNDPDNPPILHLNEEMGFRTVPGPVILKKTLG